MSVFSSSPLPVIQLTGPKLQRLVREVSLNPGVDTGVPKGGGVLDCKCAHVREMFDHAPKQLATIGYVHTALVDSSIMITQWE